MNYIKCFGIFAASFASLLLAQLPDAASGTAPVNNRVAGTVRLKHVAPENAYYHIYAVVPLVGSGTHADPRRPMYAPLVRPSVSSRADILAFSHVAADNGRFAIVEFVAADRKAFQALLSDRSVIAFEKGKDSKLVIETALQGFKRTFTLDKFVGAVVR